jgi:acetolactate synthase-1/2/3 large subunit
VEIPPDVLAAEAEVGLVPPQALTADAPDLESVRQAARLLADAKKPLIWAGGGVILADAGDELTALAEEFGVRVATTAEGKGAIPEDRALALGVGYYGHGAPAFAAGRADVILAVGTRLTGQMHGPTALRAPQRLIHLDVDARVIGKNYPAEVALVGDARSGLRMLRDIARPLSPRPDRWSAAELAEIKRRGAEAVARQAPLQCEIIGQLQKSIGDEAVVVSGITNIGYWANFALARRRPRTYLTASYFATLGFAFPTALGAKIAAPDRAVLSLSGDGGFMYALPELATAVQYGIDVVTIVFVDGAFGASQNDQRTRYQGRVIGTELHNPSFVRLAELFGAKGIRAEPADLGKAVEAAFEARRPVVIEVPMPTLPPPFQIPPPVM